MKKFKTVLSLILVIAMAFSCFTVFAADDDEDENEFVTEFSDVDEDTAVGKAIIELAMKGIVTGYPDGTFLPEGTITRAEFAVIIARLTGLDQSLPDDAVTHFSDLDADDTYKWARPYVHMATGQGVISGFEDGTFRAGEPVTYEQAVKMLMCLLGYGELCENETKRQQEFNHNVGWSVGYITYGSSTGLLKGTNSNEAVRSQSVNRGDVAMLAYNALSVPKVEKNVNQQTGTTTFTPVTGSTGKGSGSGSGGGGNGLGNSNLESLSGTVTATYITALDNDITENGKYEITLNGKDTYEVSRNALEKVGTYELIGNRVRATYDEREDIITALSINTPESGIRTIYSGYVNDSTPYFVDVTENGQIEYCSNPEKDSYRNASFAGYSVIYNGKYVEDFKAEDLVDPDSPYFFKSGVIEFIDNGKYNVAKISSYDTRVVKTTSTITSTSGSKVSYISLLYKTGTEARMEFDPNGGGGEYFVFRKGNKDIENISDISSYDVLNILRSPEDSRGVEVNITEVTSNSKTNQSVTGRGNGIDNGIELNDKLYQYNYEYVNYDPDLGNDDKYDLEVGDEKISVYLDIVGQIAAVAINKSGSTSATAWKYGYLFSILQDEDELREDGKDYKLEFYFMDEQGNEHYAGAKTNIYIDGDKIASKDKSIPDILRKAADEANSAYASENEIQDQEYQQPIRYKLTSNGLLEYIDTVMENEKPDEEDLTCGFEYSGEQTYSSSGTRFSDFSVGSTSKVIFVPDDRNDWKAYEMRSYSRMFTNGRKYNVEAYNLDESNRERAGLVLVYKSNDNLAYSYNSSFMIVTDVQYGDDEEPNTVTGYECARSSVGSSPKTYNISDDISELEFEEIDKGDIIRFLANTKGEITDIDHWFDANAPKQNAEVDSLSDAIALRTIVYTSNTIGDPEDHDITNAPFRLAYGTVTKLEREGEDKFITVSPTLVTDNIDMETDDTKTDNSVVRHKYSDSMTVFYYTDRRNGAQKTTMEEAIDLGLISGYDDADVGATRVITYSTGNTENADTGSSYLRFIYIIQ